MSEYWKSVPRKFCEFCKCWITDNKPSVEFHEKGKRHKENVELKLKEIRKKSLQNSMQDEEMKSQMEKLEQAALEAFKKDLKENPELASKYGVSLEPKPEKQSNDSVVSASTKPEQNDKEAKESAKEWYEAVSSEGYHYYWSTVTGESRWEPPDDFVSLQEQEAGQTKENSETGSDAPDEQDIPADADVQKLETMRTDPSNSRSAYGAWDVVKVIEQPFAYDETSAPPALDDIPLPGESEADQNAKSQKPKFKEKTVASLNSSTGEAVAFKKRKIAPGARNARQKNTND